MVRLERESARAAGKELVGRALNWLSRGQVSWASAVEQAAKRAEVISFDVFDTALMRPLAQPDHLFWFLESTARELDCGEQFRARRISAERNARLRALTRGHDEVTLAEIYSALAGSSTALEALAAAEFALELELTRPHPSIKSIYEEALRSGKRVVFTSDTYLSRAQVQELLARNGYRQYEDLFVSSENRQTKRSGALFRYVSQRMAIEPGRILHIGDTFRPDVLRARMAGLRAGFIPRAVDSYVLARRVWGGTSAQDPGHSVILGLVANHFVSRGAQATASPYEIGYEVLGPLYVALARGDASFGGAGWILDALAARLDDSLSRQFERLQSQVDPSELDRGARSFVDDIFPFFERDAEFSTPFEPAEKFLTSW